MLSRRLLLLPSSVKAFRGALTAANTSATATATATTFARRITSRALLLERPNLAKTGYSSRSLFRPTKTIRSFQTTSAKMGRGVVQLNSKAEFEKAKSEPNVLSVVDCFATWCGPCKVIAPQVSKLSDAYEAAHFYKVDVDEVPDVAQELNIRAMPTFVLLLNGDVVKEVVGANPKALESAIRDALEGLNTKE